MTRQWIGLRPLLGIVFLLTVAAAHNAHAQWPGGVPDLPFNAVVNAERAQLRADPGMSMYVVGTFAKGTRLRVVDVNRNWCQVVPPPGVYSYVAKSAITRGQGKEGTVSADDIVVYVAAENGGPRVSQKVHRQLFKGAKVIIQAEEGSYYRIIPPDGSYVWVPASEVTPEESATTTTNNGGGSDDNSPIEIFLDGRTITIGDRQMRIADLAGVLTEYGTKHPDRPVVLHQGENISDEVFNAWLKSAQDAGLTNVTKGTGRETTTTNRTNNATGSNTGTSTDTNTTTTTTDTGTTVTDSSQRSSTSQALEEAEKKFLAMVDKPLEEQPLDELMGIYQELQASEFLSRRGKQIVELRLFLLRRNKLALAAIEQVDEAKRRIDTERPAPPDFTPGELPVHHNIKGRLVASAIYNGTSLPRLYRLTDDTGATTIAYVRSGDVSEPSRMLGAQVGIVGKVMMDTRLKVRVAEIERIDVLLPAGSGQPQQPAPSAQPDGSAPDGASEPFPPPVEPKPAEVIED
jgi:uncharacterized protein YgiM (DUF1202 family)